MSRNPVLFWTGRDRPGAGRPGPDEAGRRQNFDGEDILPQEVEIYARETLPSSLCAQSGPRKGCKWMWKLSVGEEGDETGQGEKQRAKSMKMCQQKK